MKKAILLICIFFGITILFSGCAKTEPDIFCTIYGTVSDYSDGEPLANASIMLTPGGKTTVSGYDGSYQFDDLDAGQYTILVQKEGYQSNRKSANAVSGEKVKADITLKKNK